MPLIPPLRTGLATLSPCGKHRYTLTRHRGPAFQGPRVVFVMLNPSTADASIDDPTIRRCSGFADRLGFDRLDVVNLFSWRATSPVDLLFAPAPEGDPENMRVILRVCGGAAMVVAAWGGPYSPKPLRELIGVVRAIRLAAEERDAGALVVARARAVELDLEAAYELAAESRQGTVGHRAAWARADRAVLAAGRLVEAIDAAEPIVRAACGRVTRV